MHIPKRHQVKVSEHLFKWTDNGEEKQWKLEELTIGS